MDFLDPKKEKRNRLALLVGYCLIALAIGTASLVLLYQSYGYDIDRKGQVTQNGLVFVSSQPSGSAIYLNDVRYKSNTDTRVSTPAGPYRLRISQTGYRPWERPISVNGGDVQHFDYPFLFPEALRTSALSSLPADPAAVTQSPDRRWLLMAQSENSGSFLQYDLKDPSKPLATTFSLPTSGFTVGDAAGAQSWATVEWSADNRHALFLHTYTVNGTAMHEYILVDRDTPADSTNITTILKLAQTDEVSLFNQRTDEVYVYSTTEDTLERVDIKDGTSSNKLSHILAYETYGDNKVLYVTDQPLTGKLATNQVSVALLDGQKTTTLRTLTSSPSGYVLQMAQYDGDWYVAVGASNDTGVYLYKNPQGQTTVTRDGYPAPWRRMPIKNPTYVSFSNSTQYLLAQSGQDFVVYDFENVDQYRYTVTQPIDQPQLHATWMDGARLQFVSGGNLVVFDYDYRNAQTLMAANPVYLPAYAPDYTYLYTLKAGSGTETQPSLTTTPLTVEQ